MMETLAGPGFGTQDELDTALPIELHCSVEVNPLYRQRVFPAIRSEVVQLAVFEPVVS